MKATFVPQVVIYHDPCSDGFGAAYAIYYRHMEEDIQYIPGRHDETKGDEEYWLNLVDGKRVVICDFSFPRPLLEKMYEAAEQLLVLDHHASARDSLEDLEYCHFDMEHSGAVLAWNAFHDDPPPRLLQYIEDKDLWKFELPQAEYLLTYIEAEKRSFESWRMLHILLENDREFHRSINWGQQMLAYRNNIISELGSAPEIWTIGGEKVLATNCSWLRSEVCHMMLDHEEAEGISGCYWIQNGLLHWSLRSDGTKDVSKLAGTFGGGGHPQASGFSTEFTKATLTKRKL